MPILRMETAVEGDKSSLTESEKAHVEFIKMAKVAVATAVIRSKPDNMTGEQYASFLYQKIQNDRDKSEEKCKMLERELLDLKTKVLSMSSNRTDVASHCEKASPSVMATPPSSSDKINRSLNEKVAHSGIDPIFSHTRFLESVSRLKFSSSLLENVAGSEMTLSTSDAVSDVMHGRIVNEQTLKSVDTVLAFMKEAIFYKHVTVNTNVLFHSVDCILDLIAAFEHYLLSPICEDDSRAMGITTKTVEKCCDTSVELQGRIMNASELNAFVMQQLCTEVLVRFAKSPALCSTIVHQLVQGILAVSMHLKSGGESDRNESDSSIPADYLLSENVCYLFKALEAILRHLLEQVRLHKPSPDLDNLHEDEHERHFLEQGSKDTQPPHVRKGPHQTVVDDAGVTEATSKSAEGTKKVHTGNILDLFNSVRNSKKEGANDRIAITEEDTSLPNAEEVAVTVGENATKDSHKEFLLPEKGSVYWNIANIITSDLVCFVQEAMENTLLNTCDDYPLFSLYVWKISCLVEKIAHAAYV